MIRHILWTREMQFCFTILPKGCMAVWGIIFFCSMCLHVFKISRFSDSQTFCFHDLQRMFHYCGYYENTLTVAMVPMLLSCREERGKKLTWTWTHACNRKINNLPGVAFPRGTFLSFTKCNCNPAENLLSLLSLSISSYTWNIHVNRMAKLLQRNIGNYTGGISIIA